MITAVDVRALTLAAAARELEGRGIRFQVLLTGTPTDVPGGDEDAGRLRVLAQRREEDGTVTLVAAPVMVDSFSS